MRDQLDLLEVLHMLIPIFHLFFQNLFLPTVFQNMILPTIFQNMFLPTMPQDDLDDLREALLAARLNNQEENPVFYRML